MILLAHSVGRYEGRSVHTETRYIGPTYPADTILISHASLMNATQTVANYRASQGYSVAVIDVADLYHEFNDGILH
ncbi:MAG TPA: C25 family cysteine peptidase, partial [Nitrospiraceae bacterium]|nr:C25 family cysteine peptidase [Nitrospiraceae bacterium]